MLLLSSVCFGNLLLHLELVDHLHVVPRLVLLVVLEIALGLSPCVVVRVNRLEEFLHLGKCSGLTLWALTRKWSKIRSYLS